MPTRNVDLTEELDRFVLTSIESGRYENESEVICAALRTLKRETKKHQANAAVLRTAIDEGDASSLAEPDAFDRVRQHLQLSEPQQ